MRKEILFAILAGALFGLVIAFGVWKANSAIKPSGVTDTTSQEEVTTQSSGDGIALSQPNEYEIFSSPEVTIKGIAEANSSIVISTEDSDYPLNADSGGAFEQTVDLVSGVNEIVVVSFNQNGESSTDKVVVVYSSEFDKSDTTSETTKNE